MKSFKEHLTVIQEASSGKEDAIIDLMKRSDEDGFGTLLRMIGIKTKVTEDNEDKLFEKAKSTIKSMQKTEIEKLFQTLKESKLVK